jgi:hypothetical protein
MGEGRKGSFATPNVRAKGATTAGRQGPVCENASLPQAGPWWPAVGAPLERGVRQHRENGGEVVALASPKNTWAVPLERELVARF